MRIHFRTSLLPILLCLLLTASCGKPVETTYPSRETMDPENLNPPGTLPVVKQEETLRVYISRDAAVGSYLPDENTFTAWLEDRTGVSIDFIYPSGDPMSDLRSKLASGQYFADLVLSGLDPYTAASFGAAGRLVPLAGLIDTYGSNFKTMLETFPESLPVITAPDGNLYNFPQGNLTGLNPTAYPARLWIQSEFLERYGKGMPQTADEMHAFLTWVNESDANGNGDPDDEVGWTGASLQNARYSSLTDFFMNAFVLQDSSGFFVRNGRVACALDDPGFREGLTFLADLMAEGLLDENYVSNSYDAVKALVDGNDGATVATISCPGMHLAAVSKEIWAKYEIVPPLRGPDDFVNATFEYYSTGLSFAPAMIPASSERIPLAVSWLDACCDQDVAFWDLAGEPDVDWVVPPEGTVAIDGGPALFQRVAGTGDADRIFNSWGSDTPVLWDRYGFFAETAPADGVYDLSAEIYKATRLYEPYVTPCSVPPFFYDEDLYTRCFEWDNMLRLVASNAIAEFIFGVRDIRSDADWATYLEKLEEAGLTPYLEAMQGEYDRAWQGSMPDTYTIRPIR